jgi:hyperosmotically inducible protein
VVRPVRRQQAIPFLAVMIKIELVELGAAGVGLIGLRLTVCHRVTVCHWMTVCHRNLHWLFVQQGRDQRVAVVWSQAFILHDREAEESMKAPQLLCGVMALAVALTGCRGGGTQADANKTAKDGASDVKGETKRVAARAGAELADGWLTTKIQSKFVADREIKATDIDVSSLDGVVTLKGRVQNEPIRSLAVAIAQNTSGVKQVVDQLSVVVAAPVAPARPANAVPAGAVATTGSAVPDSTPRTDDARITSGIQAKYFLDDKVKGRRIDVNSSNGIVTLHGEVGSDDERAQALLLARTTEGVQRVEDSLTVVIKQQSEAAPSPALSAAPSAVAQRAVAAKVDDTAMTTRLQTKLSSDGLVKSADIQVTAKNGVILLEGTVPTSAAKQRALELARGAEGVTQVVDRIRVGKRTK